VANNYQGSNYKLRDEQIREIKQELDSKIYRRVEEIGEYVWKEFEVRHSVKGNVQTLQRLGYAYKKASTVLWKADKEKEEGFVKTYNRRYKNLSEDEKVYFMEKNKIGLFGCDASEDGMRALRENDMFKYTIYLDVVNQVLDFFDRCMDYAITGNYDESKAVVYFPMVPVYLENVDIVNRRL
jgi:hypothetical protein